MAENPLGTLARLLAGVALVQGRLGHQVLGQLLIAGSNDAAVAAAAVVIAGTTRTRNAVAQVALRTAAPAIAVHALLQGEERRINRLDESLRERQKRVATEQHRLEQEQSRLEQQNRFLTGKVVTLEREKVGLADRLRTQTVASLAAPSPPAVPPTGVKKRRASPKKPASENGLRGRGRNQDGESCLLESFRPAASPSPSKMSSRSIGRPISFLRT